MHWTAVSLLTDGLLIQSTVKFPPYSPFLFLILASLWLKETVSAAWRSQSHPLLCHKPCAGAELIPQDFLHGFHWTTSWGLGFLLTPSKLERTWHLNSEDPLQSTHLRSFLKLCLKVPDSVSESPLMWVRTSACGHYNDGSNRNHCQKKCTKAGWEELQTETQETAAKFHYSFFGNASLFPQAFFASVLIHETKRQNRIC